MAAGGATELSIAVASTSTVFSMRGSSQYRLQVRACAAACGAWSVPVDFSVTLPPVPAAPPSALACSVSGTRVSCNWSAVTNADLYLVQAVQPSGGPGGGALTVASRQVSAASIVEPDPLIVPTGASVVVVAACNGNGCSANSAGAPVVVTGANSAVPVLATPAAGTAVNQSEVFFSWNRVPGDTGSNVIYRLYVQDLSRNAPALDVLTTSNFYSAKFRGEGSRYDALVIANPGSAQAQGPASGFVVRGPGPAAPTLAQPRHQAVASAAGLSGRNLQLGWTPVTGATSYEYLVGETGSSSVPFARGVTPGLVVQIPIALPRTYTAIVRACPVGATCAFGSDEGWGPWSNAPGQTGVTTFYAEP